MQQPFYYWSHLPNFLDRVAQQGILKYQTVSLPIKLSQKKNYETFNIWNVDGYENFSELRKLWLWEWGFFKLDVADEIAAIVGKCRQNEISKKVQYNMQNFIAKKGKTLWNKITQRAYGKPLNHLTYLINLVRQNKMHSQFWKNEKNFIETRQKICL